MVAILLMLALVAAGSPAATAQAPKAPDAPSTTYRVGATDVLGIKVFGEDALSNKYTVDSDGSITFPLLGRVEVAGQTPRQIEEHLTTLLAGGFLRRPQVSVEIAQFRSRSIFVIGEVRNPARYTIEGPMTLLEVIAEAGSTTPTASDTIIVQRYKDGMAAALTEPALPGDERAAEVLRVSLEDLRAGRLSANILLQDNDTIIVPPAPLVYVSGYVKQPGSFPIRPGMTVRQAITEAGGVAERGSTRGIKIVRKDKAGKEIEIDADMSTPVQPNDTIKIRARRI